MVIWLTAQDKADSKAPLIVVECKADNISNKAADYAQGEAYALYTNAPFFVTHNYRETRYWRDSEDMRIAICLQTTPAQFGGERCWFTCPLIVDGTECNRRVGKLNLPAGARYFGRRECHTLTYRSCQEAHQRERLFAGIERMESWLDTLKSRKRVILSRCGVHKTGNK